MTQLAFPHLTTPPKLAKDTLRIVPLGGLGEVGRNMAVFEIAGKLLIVDCGVLFPEETQPGVDLILPDFSYIEDRVNDIVAVILTHGHEDHIGAVPYLLRLRKDIPLVGSQLTLALVEAKLVEHRIRPKTMVVEEGQVEQFGPFNCEFVAVNHSIPDALAVFIRTAGGTVLHTGDFKMDQLPLDGRITDLRHFARLGEEGVDLFMSDSTNADVPGFTTAEKEIGPTLDRLFGQAKKRIIVASFSSHVHRVQQVLDAAAKHGRKVAFVGRSMVRNMQIAAKLGYLEVPDGILVDLKNVDKLPDEKVVLMSTGSQGEPMAALSRMANGDHRVQVGPGDTVILASSLIPGNENAVFRIINGLLKLGADVIHKGNAKVHVSGHAAAGELLYCYNILEPLNAMPVHGETRHLIANGKIAEESGVPGDNIVLADNGTVVDLHDGLANIVGQVEVGFVYVDGSSVGEITDADLKDRRILGDEGFISIVTVINRTTGKVVSGPEIHARGVAEDDDVFDEIIPKINAALEEAVAERKDHTTHQLQQVVRRVIGTWVNRRLRRKPMIIPVVLEASVEPRKSGVLRRFWARVGLWRPAPLPRQKAPRKAKPAPPPRVGALAGRLLPRLRPPGTRMPEPPNSRGSSAPWPGPTSAWRMPSARGCAGSDVMSVGWIPKPGATARRCSTCCWPSSSPPSRGGA
ncbi:ribonuclease J [Arthrobacter sp. RAF14]